MNVFPGKNFPLVKALILTTLVIFLVGSYNSANKTDREPGSSCDTPNIYGSISNIHPTNLEEPSGIVFHVSRNTLFVVGDEGDVAEISTDGITIQSRRIRRADFEGITVDPVSGYLYIVIERAGRILEVDPEDLTVNTEYSIDWTLNGSPVIRLKNVAIEAITFAPDSQHTQGGVFYLANRSSRKGHSQKPSAIFEVELPLRDKSFGTTGRLIRNIPLKISGLSGLQYDAPNNMLLVVSDDQNAVFTIDLAGDIHSCYKLGGIKQEGITIDTNGFVYIADDAAGTILKMR